MITRGIREFVSRDWTAVREGKDQMLQHDPSWPDADLRQRDIESHIRVAALFRRADAASRG